MSNADDPAIKIPSPILTQLDSRDIALWLGGDETLEAESASQLARLPWSIVLSERSDDGFMRKLEAPEPIQDPLVRRRGLVHVVDSDPADVLLPPRHLAVLLLNGRGGQRRTGLAALTRRLTMLQELRRRSVRQLVIVVAGAFAVPDELGDLWDDGFRTIVTFVSDDPNADDAIRKWQRNRSAPFVELIRAAPAKFAEHLCKDYLRRSDGSFLVRVRDEKGSTREVNSAGFDDPQRPILAAYELIGIDALIPIQPSDLAASEVDGFFADPATSWRPFAAGMVWEREPAAWQALLSRLRSLDRNGVEANRILYVASEAGAGATTLLRDLAWRAASSGYPTLIAKHGPSSATGLEMSGFLTRLIGTEREQTDGGLLISGEK